MSGVSAERSATYMQGNANQVAGVGVHAGQNCTDEHVPYQGSCIHLDAQYRVEYYNAAKEIQWIDEFAGLVVTAGLNKLLDATFVTGLASPAWLVGLVDGTGTPVVTAADTMASHAGWSEFAHYTEAVRQAWTPDGAPAAGAVVNAASQAIFSVNADGTVYGTFLSDTAALSPGNAGVLYDVGQFAEGSHLVYNGGSLHVTIRLTAAAV